MTELAQPSGRFREIARGALTNDHMQGALDLATARLRDNRIAAWHALPEIEELRQRAHDARMRVIRDLDRHIEQCAAAFTKADADLLELRQENIRLKRIVADQALELEMKREQLRKG